MCGRLYAPGLTDTTSASSISRRALPCENGPGRSERSETRAGRVLRGEFTASERQPDRWKTVPSQSHRSRLSFNGRPGMQYVVRAINVDGVTGRFSAEKNTRREALELANRLRMQGFLVMIAGPDGKTVEDTE
jgi:hypothetical protein